MPGIYSKPPTRIEFASDIRCLVAAAEERFASGGCWESHVHLLVDEIEAERLKAREEALNEQEEEERQKAREGEEKLKATDLRLNENKHTTDSEIKQTNNKTSKEKIQFQQRIARKDIDVAHVFFECGIHQFFCKILQEKNLNANYAVLQRILGVYQLFSLIELDPFDDDLGVMSLLNYFLCERHSYYVDINWKDAELQHMQQFLSAFLSFVSSSIRLYTPTFLSSQSTNSDDSPGAIHTLEQDILKQETNEKDNLQLQLKLNAIRTLYAALRTFPPHRVVSRMAFCFSRVRCFEFIKNLRELIAANLNPQTELLQLLPQTVAAIAAFGIGPSISRRAVRAALCWSSTAFALPEERCPCRYCEFHRRLLKLIKKRDELGVQNATEAKHQICFSLVRGGLSNFLVDVLEGIKATMAEDEFAGDSLENISWILLLCSWAYEDVHQGNSILSANAFSLTRILLEVLEAFYASPASTAAAAANRFFDEGASSLLRVVLSLVLRSKEKERKCLIILCRETFSAIASCLYTALQQIHPTVACTKTTGKDEQQNETPNENISSAPHLSSPVDSPAFDSAEKTLNVALLIFALSELLLDPSTNTNTLQHKQLQHQQQQQMQQMQQTQQQQGKEQQQQMQLHEKEQQQQLQEKQQQQQGDGGINSPVDLLLRSLNGLTSTLECLLPRFEVLKEEKRKEEKEEESRRENKTEAAAEVMRRAPPEAVGPAGFNPNEFFLGTFGLMAVLLGLLQLKGVEQLRWRFVPSPISAASPAAAAAAPAAAAPAAAAGAFASTARTLLGHYQEIQKERCETVKKFANFTILRSEQAAGLVLRGRHR